MTDFSHMTDDEKERSEDYQNMLAWQRMCGSGDDEKKKPNKFLIFIVCLFALSWWLGSGSGNKSADTPSQPSESQSGYSASPPTDTYSSSQSDRPASKSADTLEEVIELAENGDVRSQWRLFNYYMDRDDSECVKWLLMRMNAGESEANEIGGDFCMEGRFVKRNYELAVEFYEDALYHSYDSPNDPEALRRKLENARAKL